MADEAVGVGGRRLAPRPDVVIDSHRRPLSRRWVRELVDFHELLFFLVWRDIKVRYKQTALGAAWAVLQPVLLMVVFTIFLARAAGLSSQGHPYAIFAYSALLPWTLFAQATSGAANSVVGSANLVSKVYFPRLLLPAGAALSYVIDFVASFAVLFVLMIVYDVTPSLRLAVIPLLVLLTFLAAFAVGTLLAALNVRYRDVRYAVPFLIQLWLFASPVAYDVSVVPERWQLLYALNPMVGITSAFRWAVLGTDDAHADAVGIGIVVVLAGLACAITYFHRAERSFADVI